MLRLCIKLIALWLERVALDDASADVAADGPGGAVVVFVAADLDAEDLAGGAFLGGMTRSANVPFGASEKSFPPLPKELSAARHRRRSKTKGRIKFRACPALSII